MYLVDLTAARGLAGEWRTPQHHDCIHCVAQMMGTTDTETAFGFMYVHKGAAVAGVKTLKEVESQILS